MTSILLKSKDQLLINPSFTFFPLLEGNLPQLRYIICLPFKVYFCLLFNLQTPTKRSVNQAKQATTGLLFNIDKLSILFLARRLTVIIFCYCFGKGQKLVILSYGWSCEEEDEVMF